jgi:ribosomal protein S18 acetylase RimI-like enzyme
MLCSIKLFFSYYNKIIFVYRHVQVNNEGAIDFYKMFGFQIVETKKYYYKRIEPADAHVLQKTLRPHNQSITQ